LVNRIIKAINLIKEYENEEDPDMLEAVIELLQEEIDDFELI